jgi:hypothetical protein
MANTPRRAIRQTGWCVLIAALWCQVCTAFVLAGGLPYTAMWLQGLVVVLTFHAWALVTGNRTPPLP